MMKLKTSAVHNHGKQDEEYALLEVLEDADLKHYLLMDTTYYKSGGISNELRHTLWFMDKAVRKGDFVSVHTGKGKDCEYENKGGTTTHEIYWGLSEPIWNDDGDCAVLIYTPNWRVEQVPAAKK